eukprot:m.321073 g.321073  ORF g.321073 m.321073 type:complete len:249 (+) comp20328_c0_seq7:615-1361(+)
MGVNVFTSLQKLRIGDIQKGCGAAQLPLVLCHGIEMALERMRRGECVALRSGREVAWIRLIDMMSPTPLHQLTATNHEELLSAQKDSGNILYKEQAFMAAAQRYGRAIQSGLLATLNRRSQASNTSKELADGLVACYLNVAQCHLKIAGGTTGSTPDVCGQGAVVNIDRGASHLALQACNRALEIDSSSAKGFYRRGCAFMQLNDLESALQDYNRARRLAPTSKLIADATKRVLQQQAELAKPLKKMF